MAGFEELLGSPAKNLRRERHEISVICGRRSETVVLPSAVFPKPRALRSGSLLPIWLRALALLAVALVGCRVPNFEFSDALTDDDGAAGEGSSAPAMVPHCRNGELDSGSGESDFDCGRGCSPCSVGKRCTNAADCELELLCHESTCIGAGCMNDALDGTETDIDCGGGGCKPCVSGRDCLSGTDCESGVCREGQCRSPACDDGVANGNETALDCGGDCAPCAVNEACRGGRDCVSGECNDRVCGSECTDGFANCDRQNDNGCEVGIRTDVANCGACGNVCDLPHATAECSAGECRIASDGCEPGYLDCNGKPEDGCEINLKTNKLNCGACDKICPDLNGTPSCVGGQCQIECNEGFADCDRTRDNGCEINLQTNSRNCNECDAECPADPGKSPYCKAGECGQTVCAAGRGDCNGDPSDPGGACETSLDDDADNCGACGNKCEAVNAEVACVDGKCVISGCKDSWVDCSGGYTDGCETNTDVSVAHCGGCKNPCTIPNGSPKCEAGRCQVKTCAGTFRDCDGEPKNGCEINVATSTDNCGACGTDCASKYAHASAMCSGSSCGSPICDAGYDDCSGGISDGCETDTSKDSANCGGCRRACQTDGAHVMSNSCRDGQCDAVCSGSFLTCDNDTHNGCEADSSTDPDNCGGCGTVCSRASSAHVLDNSCLGGVCVPDCDGSFADCDELGSNGCEVDTAVTRSHCGGCGIACDQGSAANVVTNACESGSCKPLCKGLYDDCDGKPQNGCEKSTATDVANCGSCGTACQTLHASATTCVSGACLPTCSPGWGRCTTPELGCVTPLGTASDCLSCGDACPASKSFCEPGGCADHRDIVVVSSGETAPSANNGSHATSGWNPSGTAGAQITFKHPLATARTVNGAAANRMIIAGVTCTDNFTNPENVKVTYGDATMTPVIEQIDANKQSYAGIYYLLDGSSGAPTSSMPASAGNIDVVARFGGQGTWGHGGINVIELRNVKQQAPFAFIGAGSTTACSTNPSRSVSLSFAEPGSFVYALLGARGGRSASLGSAPGFIESWNQHQATPDHLMAAAAYAIADDSRSVSWTVANCYNSATAMIAVERLNSN